MPRVFIDNDDFTDRKPETPGYGASARGTQEAQAIDGRHVYHKDGVSVRHILDDTVPSGVLDGVTITDAGGLDITWSAGHIATPAGDLVDTVAGSGTCTNDSINHLVWVSGDTLTLMVTGADVANEVEVGHIACADADGAGDIWRIHNETLVPQRVPEIQDGLEALFPVIVTSGCLISEDTDGTNPLDVSVSTGMYWHEGHMPHAITGYDTRTANTLVRCSIDGAGPSWNNVTGQHSADFTQWNDGNNLVATNAGKYYRCLFIVTEDNVFFVYGQEEFITLGQALAGSGPTKPAGFQDFPNSIEYVYGHNDAAFVAAGDDRWIDVRPILGVAAPFTAGGINSVVEDNTPQLGGTLDSNGNPVAMSDTSKVTFFNALAYIHATASANLKIFANTLLTLGKLGTTEFGDGTLRVIRPNTSLKIDLGDVTHWFNSGYIYTLRTNAGAGSATPLVGGVINADLSDVSNADAGEDDLMTYTLPLDTLATNLDSIDVEHWGTFAANGDTKVLKAYFDGTAYDTITTTQSGGAWRVKSTIMRAAATSQEIITETTLSGSSNGTVRATDAADEGTNLIIKMTGERTAGAGSPDITQTGMRVTYHPAP